MDNVRQGRFFSGFVNHFNRLTELGMSPCGVFTGVAVNFPCSEKFSGSNCFVHHARPLIDWTVKDAEPWPWALTFVLIGWGFLGISLCVAWCACLQCLVYSTRCAVKEIMACGQVSRTSCRARERDGENPHRGTSPIRRERSPTSATTPRRCRTPTKDRQCVYSSHPRQLGSPELVRAMACRARPILKDLEKAQMTAFWAESSYRPGGPGTGA